MVPRELAAEMKKIDLRSPAYLGRLARWTRAQSSKVEGLYASPLHPAAQDHTAAVIGERTTAYEPATRGVLAPQSEVKSAMPFLPGASLNSFSARRCPVPRQVPRNLTRRTSSAPSSVNPALDRPPFGGLTSTPSRSMIPLGFPSAHLERSPLTPTIVAWEASLRCIEDTVSRPSTFSFESTVRSRYRPTGRGPRTMRIATGPCGVNWTPFS